MVGEKNKKEKRKKRGREKKGKDSVPLNVVSLHKSLPLEWFHLREGGGFPETGGNQPHQNRIKQEQQTGSALHPT